jgi:hypothetical protein
MREECGRYGEFLKLIEVLVARQNLILSIKWFQIALPMYPVIFISYLTYVCFWGGAGKLINLVIPRPNLTGEEVPGIGMVVTPNFCVLVSS